MRNLRIAFSISVWLVLVLAACAPASQTPEASIQAYLEALVAGETDQLVNLSCAAWESQARNELASFTAVEVTLQDLQCQSGSIAEDSAVVSCSGKIVANYGNEILEIDLAERSFQVILEGGDWRMCGYQ